MEGVRPHDSVLSGYDGDKEDADESFLEDEGTYNEVLFKSSFGVLEALSRSSKKLRYSRSQR